MGFLEICDRQPLGSRVWIQKSRHGPQKQGLLHPQRQGGQAAAGRGHRGLLRLQLRAALAPRPEMPGTRFNSIKVTLAHYLDDYLGNFWTLLHAGSIALDAVYTGILFNLTLVGNSSVSVRFVLTKWEAPIGPCNQIRSSHWPIWSKRNERWLMNCLLGHFWVIF